MNRFVLCTNDYPHQLLPIDWTREQADALCERLREHENKRQEQQFPIGCIWYHIKEVPETGEFRPYP